ncbi:hypothetical protein NMY22_g3448 [Coprinellus aureogranulatus]|nr:hypothetical protein NMY22_g3448 [Coprinellus aureogranulatus]
MKTNGFSTTTLFTLLFLAYQALDATAVNQVKRALFWALFGPQKYRRLTVDPKLGQEHCEPGEFCPYEPTGAVTP